MKPRKPTIFLVAHGDHNFSSVNCVKEQNRWKGHMDNQLGVYTVYQAYFSGKLPQHTVNIQITYGEEKSTLNQKGQYVSFLGAREVMEQVTEDDLVIVIDVTSMPEQYQGLDFTIEKCKNKGLKDFFKDVFDQKYKYQIFEDTPDTEATEDQTDAFREITNNVVFFGMMVYGGDYNHVPVYCNFESQKKSVQALIDVCQFFETQWPKYLDKLPKSPQKIANQQYFKIFQPLKTFKILPSSSQSEHQQLQDRWRSSSRKFIFSPFKSHINIIESPYSLSQLIQTALSLSSYKSQVSSFQSPKQSTLIFSTTSSSIIKQQIQLNENIQQINKFSDAIGNEYLFIVIKQKDIKRVGIYIQP